MRLLTCCRSAQESREGNRRNPQGQPSVTNSHAHSPCVTLRLPAAAAARVCRHCASSRRCTSAATSEAMRSSPASACRQPQARSRNSSTGSKRAGQTRAKASNAWEAVPAAAAGPLWLLLAGWQADRGCAAWRGAGGASGCRCPHWQTDCRPDEGRPCRRSRKLQGARRKQGWRGPGRVDIQNKAGSRVRSWLPAAAPTAHLCTTTSVCGRVPPPS